MPPNTGKCIWESLEFQNLPGEHVPRPPSWEGLLGLSRNYPPVFLNYPPVSKIIETPAV